MIKVTQTKIEGVFLLEPQVHRDSRGFFYESWRKDDYKKWGMKEDLIQDDISFSKKNVLRGLHVHRKQAQLLTVLSGEIFDVVVDVRPSSKTFHQFVSYRLSGEHPQQIYMPPGTAHGFCVLSDTALLHYKVSQYYTPNEEEGMAWNDPNLDIPWPVGRPIMSERDRKLPTALC